MSIQPIPPTSAPTTAGQLAARATQNDQALAAWLGELDGRVDDVESRSGTYAALGNVAVTKTINAEAGSVQTLTLTANTTLNLTGGHDGKTLSLAVRQGGAGGYVVTWPANVTWEDGAPELTPEAGMVDVFTLLYTEGVWYGFISGVGFIHPLILREAFTGASGDLVVNRPPTEGSGSWAVDTAGGAMVSGATTPIRISDNRGGGLAGERRASRITLPQAEVVAHMDFDVSGGTGTNDRVNLAILAASSTSGLVASARGNRIVVFLDGAEVYSDPVGSPFTKEGRLTLGYDGARAWFAVNNTELWTAPLTGRTTAALSIGVEFGAYRFMDNLEVWRA